MIAPEFDGITVAGDTINSLTLHDRVIVIANSCGCGGDKISTEAYNKMEKTFGNNIHILHLDSNIEKGLVGLHIDMKEKYNKDIYKIYRKQFCSRITYVIGKNNKIIDKFKITDWESILPKIIKNSL